MPKAQLQVKRSGSVLFTETHTSVYHGTAVANTVAPTALPIKTGTILSRANDVHDTSAPVRNKLVTYIRCNASTKRLKHLPILQLVGA